jgi:putative acetyltransferase
MYPRQTQSRPVHPEIAVPDITLRDATPDDIDALFEIYAHPDNTHHLGFEAVPREEFHVLLTDIDLLRGLRVAEIEGTIVGALRVTRLGHRMSHIAELSSVAVHPDHQARGIGRAMVQRLLLELEDAGVRRVQLSVGADNEAGIAFWTALGFKKEGLYRAYFRRADEETDTDEIPMALLLTEDRST